MGYVHVRTPLPGFFLPGQGRQMHLADQEPESPGLEGSNYVNPALKNLATISLSGFLPFRTTDAAVFYQASFAAIRFFSSPGSSGQTWPINAIRGLSGEAACGPFSRVAPCAMRHSYRRESTGLARAARTDCQLIVNNAISNASTPDNTNGIRVKSIR